MTPRHWRLSTAVFVSLACALPLFAQGSEVPEGQSTRRLKEHETASAIERRGAAARRALASIDRTSFQARALARELERDPDAAVRWVAAQTSWLAYRGGLRGVHGVLQDRYGSHLDRALVLAELLRASGEEVRLARATLPRSEADVVLAGAEKDELREFMVRAPQPDKVVVQSIARALDVEPDAYRGALAAAAVRRSNQFEDALGACLPMAEDLIALLEDAPLEAGAVSAAALEAAADYWWVQSRADRDAPWQDRHVFAFEAAPAAQATMEPGQVPAEEWHRIEVRVELERRGDGQLKLEPLLVETFVPAEVGGDPVSLNIQCLNPLPPEEADEPAAAYRRRILLGADYWMPVLKVGDRVIGQAGFELDGSVDPEAVTNVTSRALGRATDLLAGLGKKPAAPEKQDALVGLRASFTSMGPGAAKRAATRILYDALTAEERAALPDLPERALAPEGEEARIAQALSLARQVDLLAWGFRPTDEWMEALTLARMGDNAAAESALATALPAGDQAEVVKQFGVRKPDNSHLWAVARARHAWNPEGTLLAAHELQVLAFHSERSPGSFGEAEGEVSARLRYDWMFNRLDPVPAAAGGARRLRVLQGVVDTYAEAAVIERFGEPRDNAARGHELAAAEGRFPVIATDDTLDALGAEGQTWRKAQEAGYLLVVSPAPEEAHRVAWRIDPTSGATLGIDLHGHGGVFADQVLQLQVRAEMWIAEHKTLALTICIACKVGAQLTDLIPSELESIGCGAWCLAAGAG